LAVLIDGQSGIFVEANLHKLYIIFHDEFF
jgi:hypothetical protein